jgi:hypothetical protein
LPLNGQFSAKYQLHWLRPSILRNVKTSIVELSENNKEILFSDAVSYIIERQAEGRDLLKALYELIATAGAQFQLKNSDSFNLTLRMLVSNNAEIVRGSDASVPSYLAVSFC